jgi:RNA polymerase sigma-70 factor (ECF subfamily)
MEEDLAHDTWLVVGARLPDFDGDERAFRLWLFSIARAQVAKQRKSCGGLEATTVDPQALSSITCRWEPDDRSVADAAIAQLLAGFPPSHAEILLMRVVGSLSAEETGALVGKSPGAVRVIQHRALNRLARRLSAERVRIRSMGSEGLPAEEPSAAAPELRPAAVASPPPLTV